MATKGKSGTSKQKSSTMAKVGKAVKDAAQTVAETADEYVVTPVAKALGVTGKKKAAKKTTAAKKPTAKKTTAARTTKVTSAKKGTGKKVAGRK